MQVGLVGLPNAGKSTLFNVVTGAGAETGLYPFTTIDQNIGTIAVPDDRLEPLAQVVGSARIVPATVQVVDIAGLVPGASQGEGLGNRFLGHIREVDAIVHVLRGFSRGDVTHTQGSVNPERDRTLVETELILADLDTVQHRRDALRNAAKGGDPTYRAALDACAVLEEALSTGGYLHHLQLPDIAKSLAMELRLLTMRPVLYLLNEGDEPSVPVAQLEDTLDPILRMSVALEEELLHVTVEERELFMEEFGLSGSGRTAFLWAVYELLGLITFFTGNKKETRAWALPQGASALEAAGRVHSDMARGFIRAEVIAAETLIALGSRTTARAQGLLRSEGREYRVQDGDVLQVLFNV